MTFLAVAAMVAGVVMSISSGFVLYVDSSSFYDNFDWLPASQLLLGYPEVALVIGAFLIVASIASQPVRFE